MTTQSRILVKGIIGFGGWLLKKEFSRLISTCAIAQVTEI
jgi:hypothetical protein